jgi:hypothetical protein
MDAQDTPDSEIFGRKFLIVSFRNLIHTEAQQ